MKTIYCLLLLSILLFARSLPQAFSREPQKPAEPVELAEAATLNDKVKMLFNEQKYKEALLLARRALEIRERLLPINDPRIDDSIAFVGDLQLALGDYDDAKTTYQLLLGRLEQRSGIDNIYIAPTLDRLCLVNFRKRSYSQAEQTCTRSLKIKETSLGPNHPDVAYSLFMLAEQHRVRGNTDRAGTLYVRALTIYGDHPEPQPRYNEVHESFSCLCHQTQKPELIAQLESIDQKYHAPQRDPRVLLESRILNGRALHLPAPKYPAEAMQTREEGKILVKVMIDETGKVISAYDMCQGPQWISLAAVRAAREARFTPTKLSGMPVKVTGYIFYNFRRR